MLREDEAWDEFQGGAGLRECTHYRPRPATSAAPPCSGTANLRIFNIGGTGASINTSSGPPSRAAPGLRVGRSTTSTSATAMSPAAMRAGGGLRHAGKRSRSKPSGIRVSLPPRPAGRFRFGALDKMIRFPGAAVALAALGDERLAAQATGRRHDAPGDRPRRERPKRRRGHAVGRRPRRQRHRAA